MSAGALYPKATPLTLPGRWDFWMALLIQGYFPHLALFYEWYVLGTPKLLTKF